MGSVNNAVGYDDEYSEQHYLLLSALQKWDKGNMALK